MKFLTSGLLAFVLTDPEGRTNVRTLVKYFLFLLALVATFTVLFHVIKVQVEGEWHPWSDGLYWTLVTMTTLGYGDITFQSVIGRLFSVFVLVSGVVSLLVMLPFMFIRLFYAPWLEARVRLRAPRQVPPGTADHVVIAQYDPVAAGLIDRLRRTGAPYFVLEPDPVKAARLAADGVSVIAGENDSRTTYERLEIDRARLVLANCDDTANTNITLTVREVAPSVPIVAFVDQGHSVDLLELSGASTVLPLKQRLGEYLASRVDTGRPEAHLIGSIRGVQIGEVPARDTPFAGMVIRDTHVRERTGLSIVGLWERGRLITAFPHTLIHPNSVVVLAGTEAQFARLNALLPGERRETAVLVIGAGRVGAAAARFLKQRGRMTVHAIDRDESALGALADAADRVFAGNAAERRLIEGAGIYEVPSVLLTTNDDAMNIYLAVYCRRLNPGLRIVSRITHERNVEAIHRAGADFALSYASLGVESVMSLLAGHAPVLFGEGVELFEIPIPTALEGRRLGDTAIGSETGLSVVALEHGGTLLTQLTVDTVFPRGATLLMLGSLEQRQAFAEAFRERRAWQAWQASR